MDMQIMVHKTSSPENAVLKCQIKGTLLCTFLSYNQSAREDIRKIIVKIRKGSNTEEYKITVPFQSFMSFLLLIVVDLKKKIKIQFVRRHIYNVLKLNV